MKGIVFSIIIFMCFFSYSQNSPGEYTISILKSNSKNSDFGPSYYTNEKIVFSSARGGGLKKKWDNGQPFLDLYEGIIEKDGQISDVKNLSARVNSKYHESNVAFAPDYKTVYFTRNNTKSEEEGKVVEVLDEKPHRGRRGQKTKLLKQQKETYLALYRADVTYGGDWINIAPLPFNSKNYSVGHPTVSRDGKKLFFTSDMPGAYGMTDIFVVDINDDGTFSIPKNLGKRINTLGREMFPFIDDNNILYFASDNRKGGFGGLDIYAVKIYENSYSEVIHLGSPINTEKDDFALVVDNNINQGYFSSNRKGGIGDDDIYHFVAEPPLHIGCTQILSGMVTDEKNKPLNGALITIYDKRNKEFGAYTTKSNGKYKVEVPCDATLKIVASKLSYTGDEKQIVTENNPIGKQNVNLQLNKIVICMQSVIVNIENSRTLKPVDDALIEVFDKNGKKILTEKANKRGKVKFELPCKTEFRITATKDKYDDVEMMLTSNDGGLSQKEIMKMKLTPDLTEVKIFENKVVVNVDPIYFPLNSAAITPLAAIELDKVVAIMQKYPKLKIEGGSHTDSRGGADLNLKLSFKRASSTVQYIIGQGINPKRITAKGYGETQPVNKCVDGVRCSEKEYQLNRRTEFVILNPDELGYY